MDLLETKTDQELVRAALRAWVEGVEARDLQQIMGAVAHRSDLVWIGPGRGEWIVGPEALARAMEGQNAALDRIRIQVSEQTVHHQPGDRIGWATNRWVFAATMGGESFEMPLRCTWIAEKEGDRWVLVHFHKSAEMPG